MSLQDLEKANAELRTKIQSLRAKLPPSTIPDTVTMTEIAELCGLDSEADAREMLGDTQSYSTDAHGREVIAATDLDNTLVRLAAGKPAAGIGFIAEPTRR